MLRLKLFSQQRLHSISLKQQYLPEALSKSLLNLTDMNGDALALYKSDYKKLNGYLHEKGLSVDHISKLQLVQAIERSKVKVIKYFSPKNLSKCELNPKTTDFSFHGEVLLNSNVNLKKEKHQNCVVMFDDKQGNSHIYVHPKVRSIPGNINPAVFNTVIEDASNVGVIGVYHSSLSEGKRVKFVGSFIHTKEIGWYVENYSGHYCPLAQNIILFLENLERKGFNLNELTVKLWNNNRHHSIIENDNVIKYENAILLLKRIKKSRIEINSSLKNLSVSDEKMADSAFGKSKIKASFF